MNAITETELETLARSINDELREAKRLIRLRIVAACTGRTVEFPLVQDADHAGGFDRTTVEAIVTGVRWTYEDEMLLEVAYVHPTTGETLVAIRYMQ